MAKPTKAGAGILAGNKQQNDQHHDELHAHQQNADAHAGLQGDVQQFDRLPLKRSKGHPAVGQGVHPDAEPGHAVRAQDSDH